MSDSKGKKIQEVISGKEDEFLHQKIEENKMSELPSEIERVYVRDVYNKIAPHFSDTRYKGWPQVIKFLDNLPENSIVADVGCGNGKYLKYADKTRHLMIGTDISENLLKICNARGCEVFVADSLFLPIKTESVDHAISIAVLHHFSNNNQRKRAISELMRIVKPGGTVLITVWAFEQNKKFAKQDIFVPWSLHQNYHEKNLEEGIESEEKIANKNSEDQFSEKYKDDEKNAVVYKRYYHLFVEGEMQKLTKDMDRVKVVDSFYNRDNWCVVLKKE